MCFSVQVRAQRLPCPRLCRAAVGGAVEVLWQALHTWVCVLLCVLPASHSLGGLSTEQGRPTLPSAGKAQLTCSAPGMLSLNLLLNCSTVKPAWHLCPTYRFLWLECQVHLTETFALAQILDSFIHSSFPLPPFVYPKSSTPTKCGGAGSLRLACWGCDSFSKGLWTHVQVGWQVRPVRDASSGLHIAGSHVHTHVHRGI